MFAALAVLVFYGSTNEGQASLFGTWMRNYVEEKASSLTAAPRLSSSQLADMNSLLAVMGGDGTVSSPAPSTDAVTISESAILAPMPPDDDYINRIAVSRVGITEYTVQEGDLLSFIASDFGVSQQSIIWANNLKNADALTPGQVLRIPPVTGVIHTAKKGDTATSLAKKYSAEVERIIAYNHLSDDGVIAVGEDIIIPDGKMVVAATTASIASVAKAVSSFLHLPDLGDYFKFPTFGFNWGRIHGRNGVDMANSCGTPVYAAADGTVTIADGVGYNGGFGKYIKISHPNGTETLYGHASKLLVEVGQTVGRGDKIMLMGTTGRSTGCHLHFEVHGARNPLAKY